MITNMDVIQILFNKAWGSLVEVKSYHNLFNLASILPTSFTHVKIGVASPCDGPSIMIISLTQFLELGAQNILVCNEFHNILKSYLMYQNNIINQKTLWVRGITYHQTNAYTFRILPQPWVSVQVF